MENKTLIGAIDQGTSSTRFLVNLSYLFFCEAFMFNKKNYA